MFEIFKHVLYVRLARDRLSVRDPKTGQSISEVPELAVDRNKVKVLAVGAEARKFAGQPDVEIVNPFLHPRSLFSDFSSAEHVLKHFVKRISSNSAFRSNPMIVMHVAEPLEGGLTQIESRVMSELAIGAGAAKVVIWEGAALTDEALLAMDFSKPKSAR
jgi:rod shape-determining protein MreB and related proteins